MRPAHTSVRNPLFRTPFRLSLLALVVASLAAPERPAAQSGYTLVQGTDFTPAFDVNDSGQVVGFWNGPGGSLGYVWTQAAGAQPMITDPALINRFPCFAYFPRQLRINGNGVIASQGSESNCGTSPRRAATFSNGSGLLMLGDVNDGDDSHAAHGINSAGVVIGRYRGNSQIPFVWRPLTGVEFIFPLNHPGGTDAFDVNDSEQIAGYCSGCAVDSNAAFVWTSSGGLVVLPRVATAAAGPHEAIAISNQGHVVGRFQTPTGDGGVFFWSAATGTINLLAPPGTPEFVDINEGGDIVATIALIQGGRVPYLYRNNTWTNINDLTPAGTGFQLETVTAINNLGWIVGSGGVGQQGYILMPNIAPVAQDGNASTIEDAPVSGQLSATDTNPDALTFGIVANGTRGLATITNAATGSFVYTPNANANGSDAFTFKVNDGTADSNVAIVTVTITPENDRPMASNGTAVVNAGASVAGALVATDVDSPDLTYVIVTNGTKGVATVTNAGTGAYTYAANAGSNGTDSFTFKASDGTLDSNVATATITINASVTLSHSAMDFGAQRVHTSSNPPTFALGMGLSEGLGAGDLDGDGDVDLVVGNSLHASVTVGLNTGTGQFIPLASVPVGGYPNGHIIVSDVDGDGDRDVAVANQSSGTVSVLLNNGSGVLGPTFHYPNYPTAFSLAAGDLNGDGRLDLVVASSAGRPPLLGNGDGTFTAGSATLELGTSGPTIADINNDGRLDVTNGQVLYLGNGDGTFSPAATTGLVTLWSAVGDFNGDGKLDVLGANRGFNATLPVQVAGGNGDGTFQAPLAFPHDRFSWAVAAADLNGDGLSDAVTTTDIAGTVSVFLGHASTGFNSHIRYGHYNAPGPPAIADFTGDGILDLALGNNPLRILSGKGDGTFIASQLVIVSNNGAANVSIGPFTVQGPDSTSFFPAPVCQAPLEPGGPCRVSVIFTPASVGPKSATLEILTADGPLYVALSGDGTASPPVAVADSYSIIEDDPLRTFPAPGVLANDSDSNGDPLTAVLVSTPSHGTLVLNSDGSFNYAPPANFNGSDSFTYRANDGAADSNVATASITITSVNDAPVSIDGTLTTNQDTPENGTLGASDVDSPSLTFSIVANGLKGAVTITNAATGAYTYTPNAGATGADTFTFKANDGTLDSNVATVSLTINVSAPLSVTVLAPNGGEKVFVNVPTTIRWSSGGTPASFDVALSRNGGTTFAAVPGCVGLPGSATTCSWMPTGGGTNAALIRVTAQNGAGTAVDASNATFAIATATPSITVTSPNTVVDWGVGSTRSIAWNHNLGANAFVRIELSRNGGASWEVLAASVQNTAAGTGTFPWIVSGPATTTASIRVTWVDGPVSDVSNVAFSITTPSVTVTAPNTNVNWLVGSSHNVNWSHNLGTGQSVRIEVTRNGGTTWEIVAPSVPNSSNTSGSFSWLVTGPVTSTARARVSWTSNNGAQDASDVDFRIGARITVTSPNTAVTWGAGSTRTITWNHSYGAAQVFDIAFSPDNGASWSSVATGVPAATATTGAFTGPTPTTVTALGLIRVSPAGNPGDGDVSNVPFTLAAPRITVTAPNTNVNWTVGSARNLTWTHNLGTAETVTIEVSRDGGSTFAPVASSVPNSANASATFSWVVSGPASTTSRIRITWTSNGLVQDVSNVNFRIQ